VPDAVTEKVAVWPTRMDWLIGSVLIEGATAIPTPVICNVKAELSCELVKEAVPDALPTEVGAKIAVNVAVFPAPKVIGSATPEMLKLVPDALAWEIVAGSFPEFVMLKL